MNILNPATPTMSTKTRQHKTHVDLVSKLDHHTIDDLVELEQAVAAGDKDKVFKLAEEMVERKTDHTNRLPQLLTIKQIAMTLNRSTRSIWRMVATGELPQPIPVGQSRRWFASDIENYLKGKQDGIQHRYRN